jgi:hypothetical protein
LLRRVVLQHFDLLNGPTLDGPWLTISEVTHARTERPDSTGPPKSEIRTRQPSARAPPST